jgi:hypothetical protein
MRSGRRSSRSTARVPIAMLGRGLWIRAIVEGGPWGPKLGRRYGPHTSRKKILDF